MRKRKRQDQKAQGGVTDRRAESQIHEGDLRAFREYVLGRPAAQQTAEDYAEDVAHVHATCGDAVTQEGLNRYFGRNVGLRRRMRVRYAWQAWETFAADRGITVPECRFNPRRIPRTVKEPLTDIQYAAVIATARAGRPQTDGVLLMALSGMRASQARKLCVKNVGMMDLGGESTLCIRTAGKGGDEHVIPALGGTDGLADLLAEWCADKHPDATVLTRPDGQPWTYRMLYYWTRRVGAEVGLPHLHPHAFRRAFIAWLERRSVPIQTIRALVGHANIQTTLLYTDPRGNPQAALGALAGLGQKN